MPEEVLETRRTPSQQRSGHGARTKIAVGVILVLVVIGIALSRGIEQAEVGVLAAPKDDRTRRILVLGDSSAGGGGCPSCFTYGQQLAASLEHDGKVAQLADQSWSPNASPAATVGGMIGHLRTHPAARRAAAAADLIVLAVADPGVDERPRRPAHRLQALLTLIDEIRAGRPVILRLVTSHRLAESQCTVMAANGGSCVNLEDLVQAKKLNVGDGKSARGALLNQRGHDVVGRELLRLGLT